MVVAAANLAARAEGIKPTMRLSEATALSDVEVRDTEVTATTAPGAPSSDEVAVGGKAVVADVTPPGTSAPSVNPPLLAQAELPQTGFDAERAAILGVALSGAGAALLAATREQPED